MSNPGFLFAGFGLAWALAFGYLWMLARRASLLQQQLDALEQRVEKSANDS